MEFGEGFVNEDGVVYNPNQGEEALDPNDINYDKDGNVESIFDRESGKTYTNKVVDPITETPEEVAARIADGGETEEEKTTRIAAGNETPEEITAREKLENETPEEKAAREKEEATPEYSNSADYVLKLSGYDNDEVELGEGVKKISELTPEEQLSIVVQEYDNAREVQATAIAEAKKGAAADFFQNDGEKEIIEFLREKGDPVELAKYILDNSPSLVAEMSDEDVVRRQIRDDFPEYTKDDIEEEVELLKTGGRLEKRAESGRLRYKGKEVDISSLSQKLGLKSAEAKATELASHQTRMDEFIDFANEEKEIAGVPLNGDIREYLVAGVVTEEPGSKTDWQKSLDDPKKQMRLMFLDTYYEKIIESLQKTAFTKGKSVGDNILKKFSDSPVKLDGAGKTKKKPKQPSSIDELDVDKMIEEAETVF